MRTAPLHASVVLTLSLAACGGQRRAAAAAPVAARAEQGRHAAAEAVLEAAAADEAPDRRGHALAARIRTSPEPAAGGWAPRALWDPVPWVRREAAAALSSRLPEPASLAALQGFVARPDLDPYTRCGAAMHLARAGDRSVLPAVQAALAAAPEPWAAAPCALAATAMGDAAATAPLAEALQGGELPLDLGFVADLGRDGPASVVGDVGAAVDLVEEPLRLPLAVAWLELGGGGAAGVLRDALGGDDIEARLTALDFLVDAQTPEAEALLARAADLDGPGRTYARLALAARKGDVGPIEAAAADVDRDVRALAMRFAGDLLGTLGDPGSRAAKKARELLTTGLSDEDDVVAQAAALGLAAHGSTAELAALEALLQAEGGDLRVSAATAILDILTRQARAAAARR